MTEELHQLINKCRKQNIKAQKELYMMFKDDVFILCLKYCINREDAQDNLQDTFLYVYKHITKYKQKGSFEGWIKRIAINKAIDKYKKQSNKKLPINEAILSDTSIDSYDLKIIPLEVILKLIQELPNQYRFVFNLYELDNYSHKEIAKLLNISESTSKSNLHRAKQVLKNNIKRLNTLNYKKVKSNGY